MTTIKLKKSIQHGHEEITELNFRKPVARDLRNFDLSDLNKFAKIQELTAILCGGLPLSVLDNLEMEDLVSCARVIASFLPSSQETLDNTSFALQ